MGMYLELAELQALNRKPMYMKDWIERLDDFLKMTGNDILQHAGTISHEQALKKAERGIREIQAANQKRIDRSGETFCETN